MKGNRTNHQKGKNHYKSKSWVIYKNDEVITVANSLSEVGEYLGRNAAYIYQLYKGMHRDSFGNLRTKTHDGFHIKPAEVVGTVEK